MLIKLALPLVLAAGIGGPLAIKHGMKGHCGGGGCFKGPEMIVEKLGITDTQKAAFKQAFTRHKPALMAKATSFFEARSALMDAGLDPANSTESLRPLQQKTAEAGFELAKEVRALYLEVLPQLTERQKVKVKEGLDMIHNHMANTHEQGAGRHHEMMMHLVGERLELTDAQKQALERIHEARKPVIQAKKEALHGVILKAVQAGLDPNTSEDVLKQNQEKVAEAVFAMGVEIRGAYLESLPVLTEAQRIKVRELITQFRTHKEGMRKVMLGF